MKLGLRLGKCHGCLGYTFVHDGAGKEGRVVHLHTFHVRSDHVDKVPHFVHLIKTPHPLEALLSEIAVSNFGYLTQKVLQLFALHEQLVAEGQGTSTFRTCRRPRIFIFAEPSTLS